MYMVSCKPVHSHSRVAWPVVEVVFCCDCKWLGAMCYIDDDTILHLDATNSSCFPWCFFFSFDSGPRETLL